MLSLIVSILSTLMIPKFLGNSVDQYGYLQIYIFYVNYINIFHFGWCDGVFLRDGGKRYQDLNKPLYSGQFRLLILMQAVIAIAVAIVGLIAFSDTDYRFICFAIAVIIILFMPRSMLSYYLQTTNRIKEYASIATTERAVYGLSILITVLFLPKDYRFFILGAMISAFVSLLAALWWCRDIVKTKPAPLKVVLPEVKTNIQTGSKLLLANISSMLVTGIVQWGIQNKWDVATYGKISFTLSVSNLLLVFINAVALVLYPTLRRTDEHHLSGIYILLRNLLMVPCLGCLIAYYPLELILSAWLPQYAESMKYMAILFPMCIYAAKYSLLVQTYLNVYRMEKTTLTVNLISVAVAMVTTAVSVFLLESLTLAMMSIVLNQMFRCILGEWMLAKRNGLSVLKDNLCEIAMTVLFIGVSWFIGAWTGELIYLAGYVVYLIVKRKDIRYSVTRMRQLKSGQA